MILSISKAGYIMRSLSTTPFMQIKMNTPKNITPFTKILTILWHISNTVDQLPIHGKETSLKEID